MGILYMCSSRVCKVCAAAIRDQRARTPRTGESSNKYIKIDKQQGPNRAGGRRGRGEIARTRTGQCVMCILETCASGGGGGGSRRCVPAGTTQISRIFACADCRPRPRVCDEAPRRGGAPIAIERPLNLFCRYAGLAATRLGVLFAMYPHGGGGGGGGKRRIRIRAGLGARIVPVVLLQGVRLPDQTGRRTGGRPASNQTIDARARARARCVPCV